MGAQANSVQPFYSLQGGATPFTRGEAQAFARSILNSQTYRDNLKKRAEDGALAPAIESMLWHYAYGKPIEQVQVTTSADLSSMSTMDILKQLKDLQNTLEEAAELEGELNVLQFRPRP